MPGPLRAELAALEEALSAQVAPRSGDDNLLVATWNTRDLDAYADEWIPRLADAPGRDRFSIECIAAILRRFDLVALSGVDAAGDAFGAILELLGPERYGTLVSSPGRRAAPGDGPGAAFVYDKSRLTASGLACEIVSLPGAPIPWDAFIEQFDRAPYAASFHRCGSPLVVVRCELARRERPRREIEHLEKIAKWFSGWARDEERVGHSLLLVGDFDAVRGDDPAAEAFARVGLELAGASLPGDGAARFAWFTAPGRGARLRFEPKRSGAFDFSRTLCADEGADAVARRIAPAPPRWLELERRRDGLNLS